MKSANPQDFNKTLNLPKTSFEMRGGLPKKEPGFIQHWNAVDLYENMLKRNAGKPKYVLHDGPPYANGDIHMGTALNKVLKDIIVKYKNMSGFQAPYVPGWDTHGLPTELKALKKIGVDKNWRPGSEAAGKSAGSSRWAMSRARRAVHPPRRHRRFQRPLYHLKAGI